MFSSCIICIVTLCNAITRNCGAGPEGRDFVVRADYVCMCDVLVLVIVYAMMSGDAVDNDRRKVLARLRKRRQRAQQDLAIRSEQARRHQQNSRDRETSRRRLGRTPCIYCSTFSNSSMCKPGFRAREQNHLAMHRGPGYT